MILKSIVLENMGLPEKIKVDTKELLSNSEVNPPLLRRPPIIWTC